MQTEQTAKQRRIKLKKRLLRGGEGWCAVNYSVCSSSFSRTGSLHRGHSLESGGSAESGTARMAYVRECRYGCSREEEPTCYKEGNAVPSNYTAYTAHSRSSRHALV